MKNTRKRHKEKIQKHNSCIKKPEKYEQKHKNKQQNNSCIKNQKKREKQTEKRQAYKKKLVELCQANNFDCQLTFFKEMHPLTKKKIREQMKSLFCVGSYFFSMIFVGYVSVSFETDPNPALLLIWTRIRNVSHTLIKMWKETPCFALS